MIQMLNNGGYDNLSVPAGNGQPMAIEGTDSVPWELIDVGRYQPRRIRGSYRGRVLG
jgi:hypothetical protein